MCAAGQKGIFFSLLGNTLSSQCSWHRCIAKVDNFTEKYSLIIIINLECPYCWPNSWGKKSEYNFADILKTKYSLEKKFVLLRECLPCQVNFPKEKYTYTSFVFLNLDYIDRDEGLNLCMAPLFCLLLVHFVKDSI